MGMVAILFMWPGPFEQTFIPTSHGDSIWNLASICPVISEEKMFKECGLQTDDRRLTEAYLSYIKLTNEPSAQWANNINNIIWAASWQNQQNGKCAQRRFKSDWADQSLYCPHEESLGP